MALGQWIGQGTARRWFAGLLIGAAIGAAAPAPGAESRRVITDDGTELGFSRYAGSGRSLVLWLPSERGMPNTHRRLAEALSGLGHEVWAVDLHESYFLQPGRDSLGQVPLADLGALIRLASDSGFEELYLLATGRGAQLALLAARDWQLRRHGQALLRGMLLVHPNLYAERPGPTQPARYLPVAAASNLPIYVIETEYSTGYQHLASLLEVLGEGGAAVFAQRLRGVRGGFHLRPEAELTAADRQARARLPGILERAIGLLRGQALPPTAAAEPVPMQVAEPLQRPDDLAELALAVEAPGFELADAEGRLHRLSDYRGRLVLVNFWASWCGPCVHEIPSLNRLRSALAGEAFEVLAVNIGETPAAVAAFAERVPIEMPVLFDPEGRTTRDWRVYVYPSNYLVAADGRIKRAHLGALQWDHPDLLRIIRDALPDRPGEP